MNSPSNTTIKYNDAVSYDKMMGVWSQLLGTQFLEWQKPELDKTWIDIGCGSGAFTEQIVKKCQPNKVFGLDPSHEQVQFANRRKSLKTSIIQVGDAMSLPFEDNCFDYAVMALVLFFVPNPSQGVSEMKRIVKPGGSVSAYVWDIFDGGLPIEIIHFGLRKLRIKYPIPPSAEASKMENLNKLWSAAGFKEISSKRIFAKRTFQNFEELWEITLMSPALQPVLSGLTPNLLKELRTIVKSNMIVDSTGEITYTAIANAIKGVC